LPLVIVVTVTTVPSVRAKGKPLLGTRRVPALAVSEGGYTLGMSPTTMGPLKVTVNTTRLPFISDTLDTATLLAPTLANFPSSV